MQSMSIKVVEDPVTALPEYARIPIAFEVREVFDVLAEAVGRVRLEPVGSLCHT